MWMVMFKKGRLKMKNNKKRRNVIICGIIILIIIAIFTINIKWKKEEKQQENSFDEKNLQKLESGTILNTSKQLRMEKKINGLRFDNIQLKEKDGQSTLTMNVTNESENSTDLLLVDIVLFDKEAQIITTIEGIIAPLQIGESTQINSSMDFSYGNTYDFRIIIK